MKFKIAGLASTALLLLSPISGALTTIAEPSVVQAKNNWDYDTADPGLGEYDRLLQNAGPSDGQIDWYPAEHFASSKNIRPSLLVKQLIDLSIATNDANSKARKVLFNDTTGSSSNPDYQNIYKKYNLAFGFIAQLLAFNNEKTGQGAYLKQGFESPDGKQSGKFHEEDKIAETGKTPDGGITEIPQSGEGINISDVLGRAFFGNATDAYAQLYVNGYDNTVQNAPNIIRETTTSITIVAQSKLTGRKATAIFKLNNKTFNDLPAEVLLGNKLDNSPFFNGTWGIANLPDGENKNYGDSTNGTFNQRTNLVTGLTGDQKRLLSNGSSSAWVDPNTGSGTIVVPRGTSAAEIAKKIMQLGYKSNYNISNVAPMKSIHGDRFMKNTGDETLATADNSYNVTFGGITQIAGALLTEESRGNVTPLSNNQFSSSKEKLNSYFAVADPRLEPNGKEHAANDPRGYNRDSLYENRSLVNNFSNSLLYNPLNTNFTDTFGISDSYTNRTAARIPNQSGSAQQVSLAQFKQPIENVNDTSSYDYDRVNINETFANDQLGNVVHVFDPQSGSEKTRSPFKVREAWDDTHAIFGIAPFTGLTEEELRNQLANNGSFDNVSGTKIKKSFTFNMPLNNSVMKSYRNPYSTVTSTALPFSKETASKFERGTDYSAAGGNGEMNVGGFTGDYNKNIPVDKHPYTNSWYVNGGGNGSYKSDNTGDYEVTRTGSDYSGQKSLHLNRATWVDDNVDYTDSPNSIKPGLYNVNNASSGSVLGAAASDFDEWINGNGNSAQGKAHSITELVSDEYTNRDLKASKTDAHNKDQFSDSVKGEWANNLPKGRSGDTNLDDFLWAYGNNYETTEKHLQLAKNIGYLLINASDLSEKQQQHLSKYEIPVPSNVSDNSLKEISNKTDFTNNDNLPTIYPVDDDPFYRGGLLGKMSLTGGDISDSNPLMQNKAGSIYNNRTPNGTHLLSPVDNNNSDHYEVKSDGKGAFAADTNVHYGLAWNDSSDLPQVKIERSHNVQYLVPVSISREVATTWYQHNRADKIGQWDSSERVMRFYWIPPRDGQANPGFRREVRTSYSNYKLFIGDVHLDNKPEAQVATSSEYAVNTNSSKNEGRFNWINEAHASLAKLLPVNNQIFYKRIDSSFPHYDSELFDHGSNMNGVTVTHGNSGRSFVGESKEIEGDTNENNVGSSDDYSIGIVKAPDELFNTNSGVPTSEPLTRKEAVDSTENRADGKHGINEFTDDPKNNNGMSIGDSKSYATLAQAYNVAINGRKAVGKADDNAKNKNDRVALVQQLLDSGGDPAAYYYIPSLPRLFEHWNEARINVVVYDQDKTAISTPTKAETKPSFSTTDVSTGNDPFNVNLRPYTTTYDDGAVLKGADVPQSFKNLLSNTLVAGNANLVDHPNRLEQVLVSAFLNSWQQNDGSFDQTDTAVGVNSPLYLYGGFGISNSDTKNSYSQWPNGYTTNTGDYLTATSHYTGDFYRGGKDLQLVRGGTVKGIPASALKADVSKVDLSKAGTYPVVYTYTNPNNTKDSASITVPVTVKDAAAPVFVFQGGNDVTLHVGEPFDRTAYKVVGNWQIFNKSEGDYNKLVSGEGIATGSDGKPQVTITGEVDTNTPGVYQVTYEATNLSGIKAKMVRKINVLPKATGPDQSDWTVSVMKSVGYINYTPGYGINVWTAPAGTFTGQRLLHGSSWKIFQKAVNRQGKVYYNVGKNQWLDGAYVSFTPVSALQPLNGIVTINYVPGYGVNLWKAPEATGGYHEGRKLKHGTQWKVFGIQDGFYKVGGNQWIQAKYAKFQAR